MYWVFNEEQLKNALAAYCARAAVEVRTDNPAAVEQIFQTELRRFLTSPEAVQHKLVVEGKS